MVTPPAPPGRRRGRWIDDWRPEDARFWHDSGRRIALRNLVCSVFAEHVGFSVWSLWSVMVLFMGPAYAMTTADKFLLVSVPTLVGSMLRIPYTAAVARFGGRNWTIASAGLLLVPLALAAVFMHPGTPLGTFLLLGAVAGVGGGNFASSMANINSFYPAARKGWALGVNAGGGNAGVAVIQLVGLLVLGTAGAMQPRLVLWIYLPLVIVAAVCAALFMDNLGTARGTDRALAAAARQAHCWLISVLYIATFGSFIGYSFAFGLVLQGQFHRSPLQAASLTFLGPLLGSLSRPLGGRLSDRIGGARVTFASLLGMAVGTVVVIAASQLALLPLFVAGFVALFVLSGIGNGSTYKMIPAIFHARAAAAAGTAASALTADPLRRAERLSGAVIGIAGAVGALGGLIINLAFRQSFADTASGVPAFVGFLVFYVVCAALTRLVYLRPAVTGAPDLAGAN